MVYKGKIVIWGIMTAIMATILLFKGCASSHMDYTVWSETDYATINSAFHGYEKEGAKLKPAGSPGDADIIIQKASEQEMDGYKKYPGEFYSPIALLVPVAARNNDSCFEKKQIDHGFASSSTSIYVEIKTILSAIERDQQWKDLGFSKDVFEKDEYVSMAIPSKEMPYYEDVYDLIRYAMNDYKTEGIDSDDLKKRTETVISKCQKYSGGASSFAENMMEQEKKTIILTPEFAINTASAAIFVDNGNTPDKYQYIIISLNKSTFVKFDMFLKDVEDESHYNTWLTSLEYRTCLQTAGLRCKHGDYNINDVNYFSWVLPTVSEIQRQNRASVETTTQ